MRLSAARVAQRWFVANTFAQMDAAFQRFQEAVDTLKTRPDHVGAITNGFKAMSEIFTLIVESGAGQTDPSLGRVVAGEQRQWNDWWRKPHTNEWWMATGQGFPDLVRDLVKYITRAKAAVQEAPARTMQVGGATLRDATGLNLFDEYLPTLEAAVQALGRRGLGSVAHCEVILANEEQLPRTPGHAAAMYVNLKNTIYIAHPSPDERDLVERLIHEFGHRHWFRFLREQQQMDWKRGWGAFKASGGRFITPYAASSSIEDYAECFAYWCLGRLHGPNLQRIEEIQ